MNGNPRKPTPVILRAIAALSDAAGMEDGNEYQYIAVKNDLQELWDSANAIDTGMSITERPPNGNDYNALFDLITT